MTKDADISKFLQEMNDIEQIEQDKISHHSNQAPQLRDKQSVNYRRKAAVLSLTQYENYLTDGEVEKVEPNEVLSFKIPGLQPNVFKNLKSAKYSFDYHLDLHNMTVSQSRQLVFQLISCANDENVRCFLITHGKAERSQYPAKIKSYVYHWLKQIDQVVAFHSALNRHGGAGSLYVLLKKPKGNQKIT